MEQLSRAFWCTFWKGPRSGALSGALLREGPLSGALSGALLGRVQKGEGPLSGALVVAFFFQLFSGAG